PTTTSAALEPQSRGDLVPTRPQDVLPLLFEIKADEISKRYRLSLLDRSEHVIRLAAVPRRPEELARYGRIEVELDAQTYRPIATRLVDSQGGGEMVYFLRDIVVNRPPAAGDEPLRPQLAGY